MHFKTSLLIMPLLLSLFASGQQSTENDLAPSEAEMRPFANVLSGEWSLSWTRIDESGKTETFGTGTMTWKFGPGGNPLIEENRSVVRGKPANDYAAIWWDHKVKKARGIWCAPAINDEGCSYFDAVIEGNAVVMTGEWEEEGKRRAWRETWSRRDEHAMVSSLYVGPLQGELKPVNEVLATKK